MKKITNIIILVIISTLSGDLQAQVLPAKEVQINLSTVVEQEIPDAVMDTLTDPFYLLQQESSLKISISIVLQDTNQLSLINIKLGTTSGGNELMEQPFTYDNINPGTGLTYQRKGNFITLGLGVHPNTTNAFYYAEVEIEDANGNKSIIKQTDSLQ